MPLVYTLVKRKDMSKGATEGSTLYHAQTSITKQLTLNKICTRIENLCTASRGEIILVLDGLIKVMNEALFNRAHIVFYPGTMLKNIVNTVSFERYVPKKDASSESSGGGNTGGTGGDGGDERPGEL